MEGFQQNEPRTLQIDIVKKPYEKAAPLSKVGGGNSMNHQRWNQDTKNYFAMHFQLEIEKHIAH